MADAPTMSRGEFKRFLTAQLREDATKKKKKELVELAKVYRDMLYLDATAKFKPRGKSIPKREASYARETDPVHAAVLRIEAEQRTKHPAKSAPVQKAAAEPKQRRIVPDVNELPAITSQEILDLVRNEKPSDLLAVTSRRKIPVFAPATSITDFDSP